MKTIEDAVIELDGKLPNRTYTKYSNAAGWYISRCGKLTHAVDCVWFDPEQFEAESKRLGYINGYRYGVEYPTNGERPDLADDVEINIRCAPMYSGWMNYPNLTVSEGIWIAAEDEIPASHFKITDQRYKPADTSYLNAVSVVRGDPSIRDELNLSKSLTHSEEGLTHSEWWDYENDCLISQPPVGETVLMPPKYDDKSHATVVGGYEYDVVFYSHRTGTYFGDRADRLNVKPLDHATRKAELERKRTVDAAVKVIIDEKQKNAIEALYDAGMLVMPK